MLAICECICIPIYFILFIYLLDLLIIYFAKFDCKLYNPPRLALLYSGCIFFLISVLNLNYFNKMINDK